MKKNIIIAQLGSPKSTEVSDVRSYLREFLSDPRVIDVPRIIWFFVLNFIILVFRPKKSAAAYKKIEFCSFFPLIEITKAFVRGLRKELPDYEIQEKFVLSEPRVQYAIDKEKLENEQYYIFPQYPQFSDTTTSSVYDRIEREVPGFQNHKNVLCVGSYHLLKAFVDLSAKKILEHREKHGGDHVVMSFHGIPERYVTAKGDIYYQHCYETYLAIREQLGLPFDKVHICFQSRLGAEKWLTPYADEYVTGLIKDGVESVAVYCPSFVADCLETTDEIGDELLEEVEELGGELSFVPCLNNDTEWVKEYANFIKEVVDTQDPRPEHLFYSIDNKLLDENMPKLETKQSTPMDAKTKKTIKVVFFTLFLDLVGFSIIFPMFPALAKYYLETDPNNYFLNLIFGSIAQLTQVGGSSMSSVVLFGGALGALYSVLQFFAAPLWGGISDRIGRKPVLLVSVFGLFLSYVMWIFAGSFTLLILARFIGGIMGGNLSTATAAVADVTDETNRSKGMAFVGIAFALGFIFGPALGGLLTLANPLDYFPALEAYGLNPFSFAAALAAILSFINFFMVLTRFEETLNIKKSAVAHAKRVTSLLKLFTPLPYKNVNLTNYSYFLFISAFSGMEFTLTFLAVERLNYTSMDNAYMFIFIGFIIAMVQGGYVRRKASSIGEKKMALQGLIAVIPGLLIIAFTSSGAMLYLGLFFLAVGSAMAIPTLTSLVSLFTPYEEQGRSLGLFRSLGSFGRVIGPIAASLLYWKLGSTYPYLIGAAFIILPCLVLMKVEQNKEA